MGLVQCARKSGKEDVDVVKSSCVDHKNSRHRDGEPQPSSGWLPLMFASKNAGQCFHRTLEYLSERISKCLSNPRRLTGFDVWVMHQPRCPLTLQEKRHLAPLEDLCAHTPMNKGSSYDNILKYLSIRPLTKTKIDALSLPS